MCDTLSDLRQGLSRYATGFDAPVLSGAQAEAAVEAATALERMAGVIRAKAAARAAQVRSWKAAGERSAASHLARQTATTLGQATDAIATARPLEALPTVDAATRSGVLSAAQSAAIPDAASADPSAETRLVALARKASLGELRAECARLKALACGDLEPRRWRIYERRSLREWTDAEGVWHQHLRHNPEVGAQFTATLAPVRERLFAEARAEGRREPLEAYGADARVARVCTKQARSPSTRPGAKVIVRVDLAALLRGCPTEGETCEIAGYGPVAVSTVRDLFDTAAPSWPPS
jgi:hypothetical protein